MMHSHPRSPCFDDQDTTVGRVRLGGSVGAEDDLPAPSECGPDGDDGSVAFGVEKREGVPRGLRAIGCVPRTVNAADCCMNRLEKPHPKTPRGQRNCFGNKDLWEWALQGLNL